MVNASFSDTVHIVLNMKKIDRHEWYFPAHDNKIDINDKLTKLLIGFLLEPVRIDRVCVAYAAGYICSAGRSSQTLTIVFFMNGNNQTGKATTLPFICLWAREMLGKLIIFHWAPFTDVKSGQINQTTHLIIAGLCTSMVKTDSNIHMLTLCQWSLFVQLVPGRFAINKPQWYF